MKTVRIAEYPREKTVVPPDQEVCSELSGGFDQVFDPPVGTEIGLLRRLRDQGTQVDLPAVQVKIPPVNAEFPESEFLRKSVQFLKAEQFWQKTQEKCSLQNARSPEFAS